MVEPHMKVQIPKYIKAIAKEFKYSADEFSAVEKNISIAETQFKDQMKIVSNSIANDALKAIQDAIGQKVSDEENVIKRVEDGVYKLTSDYLKPVSEGIKTLKDDLLAKESLVDKVIEQDIPKLVDDFVKKMKPEESKTKSEGYIKDFKGAGRESIVEKVRLQFASEAALIKKVKQEVADAEAKQILPLIKGITELLQQVVDEYVKDSKKTQEIVNPVLVKALSYLGPELTKGREAVNTTLDTAEKIINDTVIYVADDIDYEIKRLTNSLSVILMSTFDY